MRSDDDNPNLRSPSFFRTHSELAQERDLLKLRASLPQVYTWNEFEVLPVEKPREIVPGFLDAGHIMAAGGTSKAGKTLLALQLSVCVAAGARFLGAFTPSPIKVLYVGFELSDYRLKQRIIAIAKRLGVNPSGNLCIWNLRRKYIDLVDFCSFLIVEAQQCGALLIIVDPLYTLLGNRDENKVTDVTDLLIRLAKVQDQLSGAVAMIVMHHFPKGNHAQKSLLDCFSGSGALGRFVDSAFGIRDHKSSEVASKSYVLDFELRDHQAIDSFVIDLEFPVFIRNDRKDASEYKELGGRPTKFSAEDVLDHLRKHDGEFPTTTAWEQSAFEELGISESSFYRRFKQLKADKMIFQSKTDNCWNVSSKHL